jgi:hypothetical protein
MRFNLSVRCAHTALITAQALASPVHCPVKFFLKGSIGLASRCSRRRGVQEEEEEELRRS